MKKFLFLLLLSSFKVKAYYCDLHLMSDEGISEWVRATYLRANMNAPQEASFYFKLSMAVDFLTTPGISAGPTHLNFYASTPEYLKISRK